MRSVDLVCVVDSNSSLNLQERNGIARSSQIFRFSKNVKFMSTPSHSGEYFKANEGTLLFSIFRKRKI